MEWEQERHDLKRLLASEQASRQFLEEELEIVQKEKTTMATQVNQIKSLKEQNEHLSNEVSEWKIKVENLQELQEVEKKKIMSQISVIDNLKDQLACAKTDQDNREHIQCDIQVLKDKNKALEDLVKNLQSEIENIYQEKMELLKQLEETVDAKDELNNALICKRQELSSCTERYNVLQEEVVLLKIENDALKAAPQSHASKGNSVFAEVDDNRKALKNNLDKLAAKNNELKKVLKFKCSEVSKLRAEKSSLLIKMQEISTVDENNELQLINTYKSRIKDLEKTVQDSKKDKCTHVILNDNSLGQYKAIDSIFSAKNEEIESLKEQVERLSQTHLIETETIFFLKRDLDTKTSQLAYELAEKTRLQEEIKDAKTLSDK